MDFSSLPPAENVLNKKRNFRDSYHCCPDKVDSETSRFTLESRISLEELFDLPGTPVDEGITFDSDRFSIGVNADGSFIRDDRSVGIIFDGFEFVEQNDPYAGFSVGLEGQVFRNNAPRNPSSGISVEISEISFGVLQGVRITGTIQDRLGVERIIVFNEAEQFLTVATRLTNLSDDEIADVVHMEALDADQGVALGISNNALNDVVLDGRLILSGVTSEEFPDSLAIGLGSNDNRATTAHAPNLNPYD